MRPRLPASGRSPHHHARLAKLQSAAGEIAAAIEAADTIVATARDDLSGFERTTWHYSREVVSGIHDYLAAADAFGKERNVRADAAIERLASAIEQLRAAAPAVADTWAAYDLEWIRDIWLKALKRRFDEFQSSLD